MLSGIILIRIKKYMKIKYNQAEVLKIVGERAMHDVIGAKGIVPSSSRVEIDVYIEKKNGRKTGKANTVFGGVVVEVQK